MTVVVAVPVLLPEFGSGVVLAAVAELVMIVLLGVLPFTFTTIVNTAVSPPTTVALEKTTLVPVLPTGGEDTLHPLPLLTLAETNVVLAGTVSVTVTVCASLGPLLTKLIV